MMGGKQTQAKSLGLWGLTTIDWDWFGFALLRMVESAIILVSSSNADTSLSARPRPLVWAFIFVPTSQN